MIKKNILLGLICMFLGCGKETLNSKIVPLPDTLSMKYQILKIIPLGSDIRKAESILKKSGFKTQMMKEADFMETNPDLSIQILHSQIDYLYADLEKSRGFLLGERWQIAIEYQSNKVVNIYISYGKTGL